MKKILLFLLFFSIASQAQTVLMHSGTETVSTGMFYDSGGPTANHMNNENYTLTLCPAIPGTFVQLDFTSSFNLQGEPFDFMVIYEGTDDGGSVLRNIGDISPIACRDGIITSSDPSGCLTITFESDNTITSLGWNAAISLSVTPGDNDGNTPTAFCPSSAPFCADSPLQFVNTTSSDCVNTSVGDITENTCLDTAHNPAWYYMKIQNDGNLQLQIKQTSGPNGTGTGIDVDFAIWGPFSATDDTCGSFDAGNCTDNHDCTGSVVDCSWSPATIEIATIDNVHAGEIYMVLVTNFQGDPGYITMTQISPGANMTDCTIACPVAQKNNPNCGSSDGYITISKLKQNQPYHITYLDDGNPVVKDLISNETGNIIISGLDVGTYSNILIDYVGCTDPLGPFTLAAVAPQLTNLTAPATVCPGGDAIYTFTGTPNAIVTYTINSGASVEITLDAAGQEQLTVPNITASVTVRATGIRTTNTPITGSARDVSGAEKSTNAMGNMLAAGTVPTLLNSAKINGTHATMYLSLQHKVPAGTTITFSIARDTPAANVIISDGSLTQVYNSGPIDILQRITFITAVPTSLIKISRISGSVWIDAIRYSYQPLDCTNVANRTAIVSLGALTTAPIVTTPIIYCRDETPSQLHATNLPGAVLNWYGTNATGGTASATAPTPATNTPGDTTFYVSQTINGCESVRSAIVVQVNSAAIAPIVSALPITYCLNEIAVPLIATPLSGAVLNWYGLNATGGTASTATPTPDTTSPGTFNYYVSQSISGCESLRVFVKVIVNDIPDLPLVTSPVRYCEGVTAVPLRATPLSGATLNWYGNNATGGTASTVVPTPQTTSTGIANYYVSQTLNGCESPRALIRVLVGSMAAAPRVDAIVSYCQGSSPVALVAYPDAGASLNWYGTNQTGGTDSDVATIPATANLGLTTYYVSQTIGGCESARSAIAVTITPPPSAPVANPAIWSYCQGEITVALTATASAGATLNWYGTDATGGTASATAPIPSSVNHGTTIFYVSQTITGCESGRTPITVIVKPTPVLPRLASNVITYCQQSPTVALSATPSSGATLNWYGTNATGGTASLTAPTPSSLNDETTNYYVSQTVNGCESGRAVIQVQVKAKPLAPGVSSPVTYCNGATGLALTATITTGGTLKWYTSNAPTATPLAQAPVPNTTFAGNTNYYVSQIVNGCESDKALINVIISATPFPVVTARVSYCIGETAVPLQAFATGGGILNWYRNASGGTASNSAPVPTTTISGTELFYVSQTISGCESGRSAITVSVNPLPVVSLVDGIICIRESNRAVERSHILNAGLNNVDYEFTWALNERILDNEISNRLTALVPGSYTVLAKNKITGCISDPANAVVTASYVGESIVIHGSDAFSEHQDLTVLVSGSGVYEYQLDYGPFQDSNVFPAVSAGEHTVHVRDENGCTDLNEFVSVIGYLRFFTPNGDGYNDVWSIQGMTSDPSAKVSIFDRYGKLMKIINIDNQNWDGTYGGTALPSDDYWFVMDYTEKQSKKQFRGHFSLKR